MSHKALPASYSFLIEEMSSSFFKGSAMKFFILLTTVLFFQNAFAHHKVDIVTNDSRLIILKDSNEKTAGDKAVAYDRQIRKTHMDEVQTGEHNLPKIGDKLKVYRIKYLYSDKKLHPAQYEKEFVGTATVTNDDLSGNSFQYSEINHGKNLELKTAERKFSPEEIEQIKKSAIVAVPDHGVVVKESDSIEF